MYWYVCVSPFVWTAGRQTAMVTAVGTIWGVGLEDHGIFERAPNSEAANRD